MTDGELGTGGVSEVARGGTENAAPMKRVLEWFWQGAAIARSKATIPAPSEPAFAWIARAKQSDALAHAAWTTSELGGEAAASELYRQAAYWALCALNRRTFVDAPPKEYSASLWAKLSDRVLTVVIDNPAERADFQALLARADFVYFRELPAPELSALCTKLRNLSAALLAELNEERRSYDQAWMRRSSRLGSLLFVTGAAAIALFVVTRPANLAEGAPWRTSSQYSDTGCTSPEQNCSANGGFFFHTLLEDKDSWIEFDLGSAKQVSKVVVENRSDCCGDRDIPLALEVDGGDGNWKTLATRTEMFTRWSPKFSAVSARRVRLHLMRPGPMHLQQVRIY